jgi:hypothetical protein
MLPLKVREHVMADLNEIPAADRPLVIQAISSLRGAPEQGEILRFRSPDAPDQTIRVAHAGRYRVIYMVAPGADATDEILVLAVFDNRRAYDTRMLGERTQALPTHLGERPLFDVFLSYASGDATDFARSLADQLRQHNLRVWFDQYELQPGDNIGKTLDDALRRSRKVVMVLSPRFFRGRWLRRELDVVMEREAQGERVILPIWHGVNHDEVAEYVPELADILALDSTSAPVEMLADRVAAVAAPLPNGSSD